MTPDGTVDPTWQTRPGGGVRSKRPRPSRTEVKRAAIAPVFIDDAARDIGPVCRGDFGFEVDAPGDADQKLTTPG